MDRVYGVVRNLIRQLRPVGFDELGVAAALEHCVNGWRARLQDASIGFSIEADVATLDGESRPDFIPPRAGGADQCSASFECHAHRRANRRKRESGSRDVLEISIVDNGGGADMEAPRAGLGLVGMRERIAAFGGSLKLASRPGEGFTVKALLPVMTPFPETSAPRATSTALLTDRCPPAAPLAEPRE